MGSRGPAPQPGSSETKRRRNTMYRKTSYELLLSLASSLRRGFSIAIHPEAILEREPACNSEGAKDPGKNLTIILAGASNLGRLRPVFESQGATVVDLTKPGWMATPSNIESLRSELAALEDLENCAVVFDVFGNTAFKFKHVDGSLVLPFRVGGSSSTSWVTFLWIRIEVLVSLLRA